VCGSQRFLQTGLAQCGAADGVGAHEGHAFADGDLPARGGVGHFQKDDGLLDAENI